MQFKIFLIKLKKTVNLVFEPEWDPRMMTDEAKLELGMM